MRFAGLFGLMVIVGCDGGGRPIGGNPSDLAVAVPGDGGAPPDLSSTDLAWQWNLGGGGPNGLGSGTARGGPFSLEASVGFPGPRLVSTGGPFKLEPLLPRP